MASQFKPHNPKHASEILRSLKLALNFKAVPIRVHTVSLGKDAGFCQIKWTGNQVNKWDWVGLYHGDTTPDSDYMSDNWAWVEDQPYKTYTTSTNYGSSGYQARYLVWDDGKDAYRSIARSSVS
eukprot:m.18664 g.18664  ORF g.18664 m.18664 type:complete len:124 (+) comp27709_c0_seq2:166-537(+)